MSNACNAKNRDGLNDMIDAYIRNGKLIVLGKKKRHLPKYLRYNPGTVHGRNDAPSFNPIRA